MIGVVILNNKIKQSCQNNWKCDRNNSFEPVRMITKTRVWIWLHMRKMEGYWGLEIGVETNSELSILFSSVWEIRASFSWNADFSKSTLDNVVFAIRCLVECPECRSVTRNSTENKACRYSWIRRSESWSIESRCQGREWRKLPKKVTGCKIETVTCYGEMS